MRDVLKILGGLLLLAAIGIGGVLGVGALATVASHHMGPPSKEEQLYEQTQLAVAKYGGLPPDDGCFGDNANPAVIICP